MSLKTPEKSVSVFFEFSDFNHFRSANLASITNSKIHEKYQEIRNVLSLIKDYNSNPEDLTTLNQKLQEFQSPCQTPQKSSAVRTKSPNIHNHFPSVIAPNHDTINKNNHNKQEDPLKNMILKLQTNLAQNLEETKELKSLILQNQNKPSPIKSSYLDILQEPAPDLRKLSESSFGGRVGIDTGETMSPAMKRGLNEKEREKGKLMNEISSAERKVYELQSQRFLNKISELNKKIEGFGKEKGQIEEKLERIRAFLNNDKIFGHVSCSGPFDQTIFSVCSKEKALLETYEDAFLEITGEGLNFFKDNEFSEVLKAFSWKQVKDLSLFEKDNEPLVGYYVLEIIKNPEPLELEYLLIKTNGHSWEVRFLAIVLKIHGKNEDLSSYLRKGCIEGILNYNKDQVNECNLQTINSPSKFSGSPNNSQRQYESLKPRKSLKSSFHQMAIANNNHPKLNGNFLNKSESPRTSKRNKRNLQSASSKSLQPQRENSFRFNNNNNYQSTYDLSLKGMTESMIHKGILELSLSELKAITILKNGFVFLKYGKYGEPHERFLLLSNCEKKLEWKAINKKTTNFLEIDEIKDVKEGRNSAIFSKHKAKSAEQVSLSLTIYYSNKTLDLEANSKENKNKFIWSLNILTRREKKTKNAAGSGSPNLQRIITEEVYVKQKSYKSSVTEKDDQIENEEKSYA